MNSSARDPDICNACSKHMIQVNLKTGHPSRITKYVLHQSKMRILYKKLCAGMMAMILVFAYLPVASAVNADSTQLFSDCNYSFSGAPAEHLVSAGGEPFFDECSDHSACAVHYSCAPLQSSSVLAIAARIVVHRAILIGDSRITTRYPGILKPPPKVWQLIAWNYPGYSPTCCR